MKTPLHVLHIEDSEKDSALIQELLERDGICCDITRIEKRPQIFEALKNKTFDLILSDCKLPQFSGLQALEIARALTPTIPFIFVSGTIGEEAAIESLRNGATDYILKDRLSRLSAAVRRALSEAEERALCRQLQSRLHEAGRLEAVSTLSKGVAHNFNNILTIIMGHASLLGRECHNPKRILEIASVITQASTRASDVVEQLLAFARKSDGRSVLTDLNQRVAETLVSMEGKLPSKIRLSFEASRDLPGILVEPTQLERIVTNLIANAIDSMPDGGNITLSTRQVSIQEMPESSYPWASENYGCLQITDTGLGIDSATREHIFEPFYTTKEKGHSSGLGLPVVYGLMRAYRGHIQIESEPGLGTTVTLYFPMASSDASHRLSADHSPTPPPEGSETVLVIEDEDDIGDFLKTTLQDHGYHILLAHDSDEAMSLFNLDKEGIQAVFSDISLPKIDGLTLCSTLKALKPSLKIIISSGYAPQEFKVRFEELGIQAFVPKPYNPHDVLCCMRNVLDGSNIFDPIPGREPPGYRAQMKT